MTASRALIKDPDTVQAHRIVYPRALKLLLAFFWINFGLLQNSAAESIENELRSLIEQAKSRSNLYINAGFKAGGTSPGTGLATVGSREFSCGALALLLGKRDIGRRLLSYDVEAISDRPTPEDGDRYILFGTMLSNFASVSSDALLSSSSERAHKWNLDCVGNHGINQYEYVKAEVAHAQLKVERETIVIVGDIRPGLFDEFIAVLSKNQHVKYVGLGSGGGSVIDAIKIGREIRRRRLDTILHNNCYSACSLVFLGGLNRLILDPHPKMGFHRVSLRGLDVPNTDYVYTVIAKYLRDMGVDEKYVLRAMLSTPSRQMNFKEADELCTPRVATWVQRRC